MSTLASSPSSEPERNLGYRVAKQLLGVDVYARSSYEPDDLALRTTEAFRPLQSFFEDDPTVREWISKHWPTKNGCIQYLKSLFPFTTWIGRYNLQWLLGDVIGGITLGFVVVPQAMAYALLAQLSPQYGLYTSLTGGLLYWLFGTSKDIAIGATAVVSLLVGRIVTRVAIEHPQYSNERISKALASLAGTCLLVFGLLRLDFIIELIPHVAIAAFVTGASATISISQTPVMLGITGIDTREPPYKVLINTIKALDRCTADAAVGLTALILLHAIKWFCSHMALRQKHRQRMWEIISAVRMTFVIVLYTFMSWLVHKDLPLKMSRFRILGPVPTGFQAAGPPLLDAELMKSLLPDLPAVLIILIIEHIAIGKSFARINNYVVVPSQEIISIGCTNFFGPFLGAYPSTGSFTGSAILSKACVHTPLAGVFNAMILVLALYALTSVFYYIPMASLAGLIVHAVSNLITPPSTLYHYWQVSPLEFVIFFIGVFISMFESLETGIYCTVGLSAAILLLRLARTKGTFLGKVRMRRYRKGVQSYYEVEETPRDVFVAMQRQDGSNPKVEVESPYPGVFIYRFNEGYNYLNQAQHIDTLVRYIRKHTQQVVAESYERPGDRPWNDPTPCQSEEATNTDNLPLLRAVILDCSAVNNIDMTSFEGLVNMRIQLDKWAAPLAVEWHFACLHNRWTRRALAVGGFGFPSAAHSDELAAWVPSFNVVDAGTLHEEQRKQLADEENAWSASIVPALSDVGSTKKTAATLHVQVEEIKDDVEHVSMQRGHLLFGIDRLFFHVDVTSAVDAVMESVSRRGTWECPLAGSGADAESLPGTVISSSIKR